MSRDFWSAAQYQRYSGPRSRPFFDLLAAVEATDPASVVDLGCGPGNLTATLAERWPHATVLGVDLSTDMLTTAEQHAVPGRVSFVQADLREWVPSEPVDVIVSNAALQWVPDHRSLLPRWIERLNPGGWFAFQVPGNLDAPSHVLLREVCNLPRWKARVGHIPRPDWIATPEAYLEDLLGLGCTADVWETTYLHVLPGEDPVVDWVKGSALSPVLDALPEEDRPALLADYTARLREAYPSRSYGTVYPFRRVFAVAQRTTE